MSGSVSEVFKILIVGNRYVGKTNVIRRLNGQDYRKECNVTIGVDVTQIGKLELWETEGLCGPLRANCLFYADAKIVALVVDDKKIRLFD
jgi:GTPase SAR1 family protein